MNMFEELFFEHRRTDNFRNKFINQLKMYSNNLTHATNGSTLDGIEMENLKFINLNSSSDAPSLYVTSRSFSCPSVGTLNKKSTNVLEYEQPLKVPVPNIACLENPSAISMLQKCQETLLEEDPEEGFLTSTSISKLSAYQSPSKTKTYQEFESILKRSSIQLVSLLKEKFLTWIKSKSSRSSGDDSVEDTGNAKIRRKVKILWGVTRISVYDDRARTIEIFATSTQKPKVDCGKFEGLFVIRPHE